MNINYREQINERKTKSEQNVATDVADDAGICGESKNHRNFPFFFFFFSRLIFYIYECESTE